MILWERNCTLNSQLPFKKKETQVLCRRHHPLEAAVKLFPKSRFEPVGEREVLREHCADCKVAHETKAVGKSCVLRGAHGPHASYLGTFLHCCHGLVSGTCEKLW